jgi:hypothetical protein
MDIRREPGDADFIDISQSHVQKLGDVVVLSTGNEAQFVFSVVDGFLANRLH